MKTKTNKPTGAVGARKDQPTLLFLRDHESGKARVIDSGPRNEMVARVRFMKKHGGHDAWTTPDTGFARPAFQWRGPSDTKAIVRFDEVIGYGTTERPVFVLPADPESVEAMTKQIARKMQLLDWKRGYAVSSVPPLATHLKNARAVLASLNLTAQRRDRKGRGK